MDPVQICLFCSKECAYVPISVNSRRIIRVHYCQACQAEYVSMNNGDLITLHLYTTVNNKMYRWSRDAKNVLGRLWYIGEPGIPGQRPNRKVELLKSLKDHPDITPHNVKEKIQFMLPFL